MTFELALLLCAGVCYLFYNIFISLRIKNILTEFNYKIRYKFVFSAHMAGKLNACLIFPFINNYSHIVMTALSKKDIPLPIGSIAISTYYRTPYILTLSLISWVFRITEWVFIILFSLIMSGTHENVIFLYISIILILFIESIINLIGFKTIKSIDEPASNETLFEHYNGIDGDIDEKAYNSDICVQKYFQRRKTSTIKKLINASSGDVILDIGCGSGVQLRSLTTNSPKLLIGTDINEKALLYAKTKNIQNAEFVRCTAQYLPFKTNAIDKIICAELIEHLQNPNDMVIESKRVLKNDGLIVITTPNENSIWGIYEFLWDKFGRGRNYGETHLRFFSIKDLNKYFESFTKKSSCTIFFISPFVALLNNRTLLKASRYFDIIFEKLNCGVSIIYYAKKK